MTEDGEEDGGVHQYRERGVYVNDTEGWASLECGFDGEAKLSISRHVAVEWSRGVGRGVGGRSKVEETKRRRRRRW